MVVNVNPWFIKMIQTASKIERTYMDILYIWPLTEYEIKYANVLTDPFYIQAWRG
jgi:hypothetical protein